MVMGNTQKRGCLWLGSLGLFALGLAGCEVCQSTFDCAKGEACLSGRCREVDSCSGDFDCLSGQRCVNEVCAEAPPSSDARVRPNPPEDIGVGVPDLGPTDPSVRRIWPRIETGTDAHLHGVWGESSSNVWAVGAQGTILHYDGDRWTRAATMTDDTLFDVHGADQTVWAVGASGTVLRQQSVGWGRMPGATAETLSAVHVNRRDDVWMVGMTNGRGVVYHYNGLEVAEVPVPTTNILLDVWASGPFDVWVVGAASTLLHYDGQWRVVSPPAQLPLAQRVQAIGGAAANDVWALADDRVMHFDGVRWSVSPPSGPILVGADVWASGPGQALVLTPLGALFEARADPVLPPHLMPAGSNGGAAFGFEAIFGFVGSDVWAVGNGGAAFLGPWPTEVYRPPTGAPPAVAPGFVEPPQVRELASDGSDFCALLSDGNTLCTTTETFGFEAVSKLEGSAQLAVSGGAICGVTQDRRVRCHSPWSSDESLELFEGAEVGSLFGGDGRLCGVVGPFAQLECLTLSNPSEPYRNPLVTDVVTAFLGAPSCALQRDWTVHCWGQNRAGEVGDGTHQQRIWPRPVLGLSNITSIAGGYDHACASNRAGRVYCWGDNQTGQLGSAGPASSAQPVEVPNIPNAQQLVAGQGFSCALVDNGAVWCWGANDLGQLADGTNFDRAEVAPVSELSGVVSLAAGWASVCALTEDGSVWCWGAHERGNLPALSDGLP